MRLLCVLISLLLASSSYAQSCIPTLNVKVVICPNKQDSLSMKYCNCYDCFGGVKAIDKNYSIISFKIRGERLCNEEHPEMEAQNTGAAWNEAQFIFASLWIGYCKKYVE